MSEEIKISLERKERVDLGYGSSDDQLLHDGYVNGWNDLYDIIYNPLVGASQTGWNAIFLEMRENHISYTNELKTQLAAKQAQIDALMMEYCPEEMTAEQIKEWGENQKVVKENDNVFVPTHRHYKGGLYKILHHGKMEDSSEDVVIYTRKEGDVWVRPTVVFNEKFTKIDDELVDFDAYHLGKK